MEATILQFGTGRFLRCFLGLFAEELNAGPAPLGRITAVQSTGAKRAEQINAQDGVFHVAVRGLADGKRIDRLAEIRSVFPAIAARRDWEAVLDVGRADDLKCIVSNTTEAGLTLSQEDRCRAIPPASYPAKLLSVLEARYQANRRGIVVLPCELVEGNASRLLDLVLEQADIWHLDADLIRWVREECRWQSTLVDRIVAAPPADDPLVVHDPLFAVTEPYVSWVIEGDPGELPLETHPAIEFVDRLAPYHLRKVRILNGAHTALVAKALPLGIETVREAAEDGQLRPWLETLLFDEIVPTISGRVEGGEPFARSVLERFSNPFLEHRLADIALHHEKKVETRLRPTCEEYEAQFGRKPALLGAIVGAS